MARTVSIRRSLLANLLLVILALSVAIVGTTLYGPRQLVSTLSRTLLDQSLDTVETELAQVVDPVNRALGAIYSWGQSGLLDAYGVRSLDRLFEPLMHQYPQLVTLLVADSRGREYMLTRHRDRWLNRETRLDVWGPRTRWRPWQAGRDTASWYWRRQDYDPRKRPWFVGAVRTQSRQGPGAPALAAYWSAVYPSAVGQEPAITAALHLGVRNGVERVAAVDLRLGSMPRLELDASATRVFVFTENRRLLAASSQAGFTAGDWRLKTPTEVDWPLPRDALEQVVAKRSSAPVRFRSATVTYWGDSRRLNLGRHRSLVLLAVVPESELLGNLPQARVWLACLMLAVLALALLRAVALARRYSEPIEALVVQSDRISRGELDAAEPVPATITEVSKLAQAHERMRTSLKALIRLEDDLQLARRIQQNTFPSELPSATGFDIAAWSEPADQTGGDTYDVVGFRRATAGGREARLSMQRPDHLMLLLADATGHGIGPALSATQIRAMLRMAIRSGEDMANIARHINDQLCDDLFGGRFITAWLGRLDISKRTLTSFSAGQAPLLHFRAATRDVGVIAADTAPFGVLRELEIHIAPPLPLERGDIFAVLSDGIIDATGAGGERFGVARACAILTEHHADSAEELLMKLRHTLDAFTGTRSPDDDCTALLLKRTAR